MYFSIQTHTQLHNPPFCSDEGLTLETSASRNSLRRLIYLYQLRVDNGNLRWTSIPSILLVGYHAIDCEQSLFLSVIIYSTKYAVSDWSTTNA